MSPEDWVFVNEQAAAIKRLEAELTALRARNFLLESGHKLLETVFAETAQELGCKQDNEAVLEAIAALRARAVPAIVWGRFPMASRAQVGAFRLTVEWLYQGNSTMRWRWWINMGDTRVANGSELGYPIYEEAEATCEATFLRLVGVGS